ncbi:MAG: addiction module protein [Cyanobacteria bacterium]|nr:addiction module protein [Cyanobacteriota bacterium]
MDSCRTNNHLENRRPDPGDSIATCRESARVADCILRSLNQTVSEVDKKWADLAARRLQDIQTGVVKPVAAEDVFAVIWRRLN